MHSFTITESLLLPIEVEYTGVEGDETCSDSLSIESVFITVGGKQIDIISLIDPADLPALEESAWSHNDKLVEGQDEERAEYVYGRRNE
jgi:hypothetical protein